MQSLLSRLLGSRQPSKNARSARRGSLRFEQLDERRMLAIAVHFDDGFRSGRYYPEYHGLWINGSENADQVEVKVNNSNGRLTVYLTENNYQRSVFNIAAATVPVLNFYGRGGDDTFTSNFAGKSVVYGGAGNDTLKAGWGEVFVYGEAGKDTLSAGNLAYGEFHGGSERDVITGTALHNVITGDDGDDILDGGGGDDTIDGGMGDDQIFGGSGDDELFGGPGRDTIFGNEGNDTIVGGLDEYFEVYFDDDKLYGGDGIDFLYGGAGDDLLCGCEKSAGQYVPDGNYDYLAGQRGKDIYVRTYVMSDGWLTPEDEFSGFSAFEGDRFENVIPQNFILEYPTASLLAQLSQKNGFAMNTMSSEEELWDAFYASEAEESASILETLNADEALAIDPQFTNDSAPIDEVFTDDIAWADAYVAPTTPTISRTSLTRYSGWAR